jgi:TPR repeat protein
VRARLGSGSFGTVYRAYDPQLDREVALKLLRPEALAAPGAVERFRREAQAAARMLHPHIVPVHDAGEHDGRHFIAAAYIAGRTLASAIPDGGMEPRRAAALTAQLLDALAYAHGRGVLHRDVKPSNALLDDADRLYLTDFGLARPTERERTRLTEQGALLGTPAYMAPEQIDGDASVGPAADQYSAGVVLYQLLTGRLPFEGSLSEMVYQAVHRAPPPPSQVRPGLDAGLEAICLKALAKRPQDRHADAAAFAAALRGWRMPAPSALAPPPAAPPASGGKGRRRALAWAVGAASALAVGAALCLFAPPLLRGPGGNPDAAEDDLKDDREALERLTRAGDDSEIFVREHGPRRFAAWRAAAERGMPEGQFLLARCYELGAGARKDLKEAVRWYEPAAEQNFALAQNNLGVCRHHGRGAPKDAKEAARLYRAAGGQGLAPALNNLGVCYERGEGVERDPKEAVDWYRRAAERGYAPAQANLGRCYADGVGVARDLEKAVEMYKQAAGRGLPAAQTSLGVCYQDGAGVGKDASEAVRWFRKAAELGDAQAQYQLGRCFQKGEGAARNWGEAIRWYEKAAEQGLAPAQTSLAQCYEQGVSTTAFSPNKAFVWYARAADQGDAEGQYHLARYYGQGLGTKKDPAKAAEWYHKAAEQGHAAAQNNLGECYYEGLGVAKDMLQAVRWYRKAAEQDNLSAQANLGLCYQNGAGTARDQAEAVRWYRKAAEGGDARAQYLLGQCYETGAGVGMDSEQAAAWFRKAADQGYEPARKKLAKP